MKKQSCNPYLPSWEYIPDGEPYLFDGRVYVYGSHDKFNGHVFCYNDYVCWSAPEADLSDWRYEGVILKKTEDPLNKDGRMCMYAPDVTRGPDGRYYIYYVLDKVSVVSVAVCDTPAGEYKFHGYVHYPDGTRLGEREGDEPQFDPGVLTEGDTTYLYTGFSWGTDKSRHGAMATVLGPDMLTIKEAPVFVVPSGSYSEGTGFEGHEYFEAASIRKHGDTYYFVYSSVAMNELCYATSKHPLKGFTYGGVLVSNCDLGVSTYKPAELYAYPAGNNHGSIIELCGRWYVFYHRQTNSHWFSRQGCIEPIEIAGDGSIKQVEMTSQGANLKPLNGHGEYPAYIACNLFSLDPDGNPTVTGMEEKTPSKPPAKITQDGKDGDEEPGYVAGILDGTVIGFKYFDCKGVSKVTLKVRAYGTGHYELRLSPFGEPIGKIDVASANEWTYYSSDITIPDGVHALYFVYRGNSAPSLGSITLE